MFESNLEEIKSGQCVISDLDGKTLEAMIWFMYGINEWDPTLASKVIVGTNKYEITHLEEGRTKELMKQLTAENAAELLQTTDELAIAPLKEAAMEFLSKNLDNFLAAGGFVALAPNLRLMEEIRDAAKERRGIRTGTVMLSDVLRLSESCNV